MQACKEHKAAKAAKAHGKPIPETPTLDKLNREYAMSPAERKAARAAETRSTNRGAAVPAPKAPKGWSVIALRSGKHEIMLAKALGNHPSAFTFESGHMLVNNESAPDLISRVSAWATANRKVIYDARLAVATYVRLRRAYPKVSSDKGGVTTPVVTALNKARTDGAIKDWDVEILLDGRLEWHLTEADGKVTVYNARDKASSAGTINDLAARLGVERTGPPRPVAKKAPAKKAPAKKAPARAANGKAPARKRSANGSAKVVGDLTRTEVTPRPKTTAAARRGQRKTAELSAALGKASS